MELEDELTTLQERVQATGEQLRAASGLVRAAVEQFEPALTRVTESWSGSFAGYHARLYYRNFVRPPLRSSFSIEWGGLRGLPEGWGERTPEEVLTAIETIAAVRITTVEEAAEPVAQAIEALRDDIAVALAPIRQLPSLATEARMLDALEQMKVRVQLHEYLNANMGGINTRDRHAALQGTGIPSHLYYAGQLRHATSVFEMGEPFLRAADRLIRQVRARQDFLMMIRAAAPGDALDRVVRLCERFHQVALQAQKRQHDRIPFEIKDEYDTQDLMSALLQIDFNDVRREERSPSHAGAAPSIDFLLKAEQIAVEVKMARESMTAKTLGDELLADIGRYGAHPDCRTLVCFVYDPRQRLKNPRGLEGDLEGHSRDGLRVVAVIAPR